MLFAALGSGNWPETAAESVRLVPAAPVASTTIVSVSDAPMARLPIDSVTTPFCTVGVKPPFAESEIRFAAVGSVSVRVTLESSAGPLLVAVTV